MLEKPTTDRDERLELTGKGENVSGAKTVTEAIDAETHYYAAYRAAGEVFGRLRDALDFGELVMRTWGQSARPHGVAFQWTFKVGDRWYRCEEIVTFMELMELKHLEAFASHLCDKWKREVTRPT